MKKTIFRLPKISVDWEDTAPPNDTPSLPASSPAADAALASNAPQNTQAASPAATNNTPPPQNASPPIAKKRTLLDVLLGTNRPPKPPRTLMARLFGLRIGQFLNLFLWSVVIGGAMKLTNFNPLNPQFNASETAGNVWQQGWSALAWIVKTSWQPALTGAVIIIPIWFTWRILTLPFRR
ncbi:hypothetical protein [Hirschia litorea]|uniref:Uncharacterized protein n=1 Tax=Hirschia litorea TaxID=1199156 RepID=A0ABW2IJ87_9PROT